MLDLIKRIDALIETIEAVNFYITADEGEDTVVPVPLFSTCRAVFTEADALYMEAAIVYVTAANSKEPVPKNFDDLGVAIEALATIICELKITALKAAITRVPEEDSLED